MNNMHHVPLKTTTARTRTGVATRIIVVRIQPLDNVEAARLQTIRSAHGAQVLLEQRRRGGSGQRRVGWQQRDKLGRAQPNDDDVDVHVVGRQRRECGDGDAGWWRLRSCHDRKKKENGLCGRS